MSDTPRTETYVLNPLPQVVSAEWARQLERGLNAANDRIKRLERELESTKADRDSWSNQSDEFAKTAADLIIHIQRLEEAGDALYENSYPTRWDLPEANARKMKEQEAWLKAKEAKP